jgi:hypothetical protein
VARRIQGDERGGVSDFGFPAARTGAQAQPCVAGERVKPSQRGDVDGGDQGGEDRRWPGAVVVAAVVEVSGALRAAA